VGHRLAAGSPPDQRVEATPDPAVQPRAAVHVVLVDAEGMRQQGLGLPPIPGLRRMIDGR
jgi:hypothetical protein